MNARDNVINLTVHNLPTGHVVLHYNQCVLQLNQPRLHPASSTQSSSSCLFIYDERRTQQQNNVLKLERPTINHVMRGGGREGKPHTINHNSNEGALGTTQLEGVCQAPIINKHMGRHTTNMLLITRETCCYLVRFSFAFGTRQTIIYYQKIMHHHYFYHKRSNSLLSATPQKPS